MLFFRAEAVLIASSGSAASVSFFRYVLVAHSIVL